MNQVMDNATKTMSFIRASALYCREFLALLEDAENEYGEIS
jgi:hypothetical protein